MNSLVNGPMPTGRQELLKVNCPPRRGGFTLIEVLLVIGIMVVIAGFTVPNFLSARPKKALNSAITMVVADIRGTMEASRAQQDGDQWWIRFENTASGEDIYIICSGNYDPIPSPASCADDDASGGGVERSRRVLTNGVVFINPDVGLTKVAVFKKSTGLPTVITVIKLKSGELEQEITINTNGLVNVQ